MGTLTRRTNVEISACFKQARLLTIFLFAFVLYGCGGRFDIYSPSEIHRTVKLLEPGTYVVSYKWRDVIENYGPDMKSLLSGVDDKDKPAIWKQAMASAVPKYLEAKGIVPAECSRGVNVTRSGETEGGGGWAEFRCK